MPDPITIANVQAAAKADAINPDGTIPGQDIGVMKETPNVQETPVSTEETTEKEDTSLFDAFLQTKGEEPKQEEKPTVQPVVKQEAQQARDYSDLDEEDVQIFKNMSNKAFNKMKPVYKEYKTLKQTLAQKDKELADLKAKSSEVPPSIYQHEEGYVLDPGFRQAYSNLNTAKAVAQHWENQLNNIRQGAKEIDNLVFNQQTKQFEIAGKVQADVNSETEVLRQVTRAQTYVMQQEQQVQNAIAFHKQNYSGSANAVAEMQKNFFGKLETDQYKPVIQQQLEMIPAIYRNHPVAQLAARSLVMNALLANLLKSAAAEKTATKIVRQPSGPTASEAAADGNGKSSNNNAEVSFADFQKAKDGF